MERSNLHYEDDLKANFRSWQRDSDNEKDARQLMGILHERHPDVPAEELKEAAFSWVGVEEKKNPITDNGPKYNRPVTDKEAQIIDGVNDFFDGERIASSVVVEIAHIARVQTKKWMMCDGAADRFLIDCQELMNPDVDEYGEEIYDANIVNLMKLILRSYDKGYSYLKSQIDDIV